MSTDEGQGYVTQSTVYVEEYVQLIRVHNNNNNNSLSSMSITSQIHEYEANMNDATVPHRCYVEYRVLTIS